MWLHLTYTRLCNSVRRFVETQHVHCWARTNLRCDQHAHEPEPPIGTPRKPAAVSQCAQQRTYRESSGSVGAKEFSRSCCKYGSTTLVFYDLPFNLLVDQTDFYSDN